MSISNGLRHTVEFLKTNNFSVIDPEESNITIGLKNTLPYPHLIMWVEPERLVAETKRLLQLIETDLGFTIDSISDNYDMPAIEGNFDPVRNVAVIVLSGVNDKKLFGNGPLGNDHS